MWTKEKILKEKMAFWEGCDINVINCTGNGEQVLSVRRPSHAKDHETKT